MAYHIISVRVNRSLYNQLKALAEEEDSTITALTNESIISLLQDRKERSSKIPIGFICEESIVEDLILEVQQ